MLDHQLKEKVSFLASPGALAGAEESPAEARETHMSWVFLTRDCVFKLKKPVRFPYLDFSTCAAREAFCREELRLNQALAPGVYVGLARLTRSTGGGFEIDGAGPTVDWLVVMRRLPEDRMLDNALERGLATRREIEQLVAILSEFYQSAPQAPLEPDTYLSRIRRQLLSDRDTLTARQFPIDHQRCAMTMDRLDLACSKLTNALAERAERLVEGHGDLRPEHVCLGPPIRIIDRLEFNRGLRRVDPFDELAFLGMECAMLGAAWVAPLLLARAEKALPDPPQRDLILFYAALRASLRARLALAHLSDEAPREPDKWAPRAESYLDQADAALTPLLQAAP